MRAAAIVDGKLTLVERPIPQVGPADVLVKIERAGVCGTDLHMPHRAEAEGIIPGHEVSGTVTEIGTDVDAIAVGQRIAVMPSARCLTCDACLRGDVQLCYRQWEGALGFGRDGGYAEYVTVPAASCYPLPDGMSWAHAALVEPYSVALHGVNQASPKPTDAAIVIGAGPVGLLVTAVLAARGLTDITVVEPSELRASTAKRLGATTVLNGTESLPDGDTGNCALVVECSGADGLVQESVRLCRAGGTVVILGVPTEGRMVSLQPRKWLRKEISLKPSIWYTIDEFKSALETLAVSDLTDEALGLSTRRLDEAPDTFAEIPAGHLVKVQFDPTRL
ncbi:zinc-binding dehydrogenase [Rhodococcus sp. NPDC060176]|uniref:zinc-dependent alcohol dehydrogenase n=1 Tax=Rhodococcus sp. NPDC060176 TaxID=3347062 RepID=UPI00364DC322